MSLKPGSRVAEDSGIVQLFPGPAVSRDPAVPEETSAWSQRLLQLQQW